MFKHILVPTDGSVISENAVKHAVDLAKQCHGELIALHVTPKFHVFTYHPEMLEATREGFVTAAAEQSKHFLESAQSAARAVGVECHGIVVTGDHPYRSIVEVAQQCDCDLIVMASHGRRGVEGFLLGSETQKVLAHSQVPVLVYR